MKRFLLSKYQFRIFLITCIIFTAPFAFFSITGQIENEAGMIMYMPFLLGLPWILLYRFFDIPGFTSPALPESSSNILTLPILFLFMIPVYINIYLLVKLLILDERYHQIK